MSQSSSFRWRLLGQVWCVAVKMFTVLQALFTHSNLIHIWVFVRWKPLEVTTCKQGLCVKLVVGFTPPSRATDGGLQAPGESRNQHFTRNQAWVLQWLINCDMEFQIAGIATNLRMVIYDISCTVTLNTDIILWGRRWYPPLLLLKTSKQKKHHMTIFESNSIFLWVSSSDASKHQVNLENNQHDAENVSQKSDWEIIPLHPKNRAAFVFWKLFKCNLENDWSIFVKTAHILIGLRMQSTTAPNLAAEVKYESSVRIPQAFSSVFVLCFNIRPI